MLNQMSTGEIDIREHIFNLKDTRLKMEPWPYILENILHEAKELKEFNNLPNIAVKYCFAKAKTQYIQLLHYAKRTKNSIKKVLEAVIKSLIYTL